MSALRGNPSIEEVRAQLRTFEPLLIWGGDGERETDDNDPPADDDQDVDDDDDTDDDEQDDDQDDDPKDKSKAKTKSKSKKDDEPTLEEQLDAEKRKNIQLQRQITKNKNAQTKADADKDVTKDRDRLKTENDQLRSMMDDNLLEWSIGKNKKFQWQNEGDVMAFINTDAISIDLDNKKIEGLDLELKRIAKEKPYLLKPKEVKKDDDKVDETPPGVPSGSHPRGGSAKSSDAEKKRLGEKYKIPGYGTQTLRAL